MSCIGGHFFGTPCILETSEGSKSSTHYLSDKNRFDVSSKGPPDEGLSASYTGHVLFFRELKNHDQKLENLGYRISATYKPWRNKIQF